MDYLVLYCKTGLIGKHDNVIDITVLLSQVLKNKIVNNYSIINHNNNKIYLIYKKNTNNLKYIFFQHKFPVNIYNNIIIENILLQHTNYLIHCPDNDFIFYFLKCYFTDNQIAEVPLPHLICLRPTLNIQDCSQLLEHVFNYLHHTHFNLNKLKQLISIINVFDFKDNLEYKYYKILLECLKKIKKN